VQAYPLHNNYSAMIDRQGKVWALSIKSVLYILQPNGSCRLIDASSGLPANIMDFSGMTEDLGGNMWFFGKLPTLWMYPQTPFVHFNEQNGIKSPIIGALYADQGQRLWVASIENHLYLIEKGTVKQMPLYPKGAFRYIKDILPTQDGLLLGCSEGLWQYWPSGKLQSVQERYGLPPKSKINHLLRAQGDSIYVAHSKGLSVIHLASGKYRKIHQDDRASNYLLLDKDGAVWAFYTDQVVKISKGQMVSTIKSPKPMHPSQAVFDPKGNIWMACYGMGVGIVQNNQIHFLGQKEGVPLLTYTIVKDQNNNIWLGHHEGLQQFSFDKDGNIADVRLFNRYDGFIGEESNGHAALCDQDGRLWWGTPKGIMGYQPENAGQAAPLEAQIIGISAFGQYTDWHQAPYQSFYNAFQKGMPQQLQLPSYVNQISFDFASNHPSRAHAARYRYKLIGPSGQPEWSLPSAKSNCSFAALAPGQYQLLVQATENQQFATTATYNFIIKAPFWQTWWFWTVSIMAFAFVVFALFRILQYRKLARELEALKLENILIEERRRISQDMHDDIGSSLSKIAILSEVIKTRMKDQEEASQLAGKVSQTAREVIESLSEIVWNMKEENSGLSEWVAHMQQYVLNYSEDAGLSCVCHFPAHLPALKLSHYQRRNLFMCIKESLHNIVKHANANQIDVKLEMQSEQISICIADNGVGFSIESLSRINGLQNMKHRMAEIGGACHISGNSGTKIQLCLPIHALYKPIEMPA
jgi:signal transduction histidine kinase